MKNKLIVLLGIALLSLTACNKNNQSGSSESETEPISSETTTEEVKTYDERDYQYTNKISEPSTLIHNMEDLKLITDYHAFYKDVESFDVTVAPDYVYSTNQKKVENEINYLYWYGELVNGVMGISGTSKNDNTWTINYTYYNNAYIDGHPTTRMLKDVLYQEPSSTRAKDYNYFATEDESKTLVDVATSQQLWYAAEHGYRINPLPNTPAEKYYNLAKDLLRNIISDDMSEYQKTSVIYDYIEHHSSYCYEALDAPESEDPDNYPDKYCAGYKAFFIEGFFDNNTVVCDGFSKVYTLLGRMEGLNIVRGSGTSDKRWTTKRVAGHAYCFVGLDGTYYLSCPTWGQARATMSTFYLQKEYFLSPKSFMDSYQCQNWQELNYATSRNIIDYFKNVKMEVKGQQISAYITNQDPALYNELLSSNPESFMDIYFASSLRASDFLKNINARYTQVSENEFVLIND